jgi:hypothetical protein
MPPLRPLGNGPGRATRSRCRGALQASSSPSRALHRSDSLINAFICSDSLIDALICSDSLINARNNLSQPPCAGRPGAGRASGRGMRRGWRPSLSRAQAAGGRTIDSDASAPSPPLSARAVPLARAAQPGGPGVRALAAGAVTPWGAPGAAAERSGPGAVAPSRSGCLARLGLAGPDGSNAPGERAAGPDNATDATGTPEPQGRVRALCRVCRTTDRRAEWRRGVSQPGPVPAGLSGPRPRLPSPPRVRARSVSAVPAVRGLASG